MIPKHQAMKLINNGTVLSLLNTHTQSAGWIKSMCVPVLQTLLGRVGYRAQQSCNPERGEETPRTQQDHYSLTKISQST